MKAFRASLPPETSVRKLILNHRPFNRVSVCVLAVLTFLVLLILVRFLIGLGRYVSAKVQRIMPRRVANVLTGWDADKIATLKNHLRQKMDRPDIEGYEQRGG